MLFNDSIIYNTVPKGGVFTNQIMYILHECVTINVTVECVSYNVTVKSACF